MKLSQSDEPANTHVQIWFAYCLIGKAVCLRQMGRMEEGDGVLFKARGTVAAHTRNSRSAT